MRLLILIFFLLCYNVSYCQVLSFINSDNIPVSDVYVELININSNQKLISDSDGIVIINNNQLDNLKKIPIKISHISYKDFEGFCPKGDTIYKLIKSNILLDQIFVTAQISANNLSDVIQKTLLINRENIDSQAAINLKDLLEKQMNMRISNDNILGSSISIQGISGQNIKVLIDGVPVVGRLNGNVDLSQINLNNIERVEIVEGPLSVNFGTDALAGTINLITRTNLKEKFSSLYNLYYESVGHYNSDLTFSYKLNNKTFSLDVGRNYFDGWSDNEVFQLIPSSQLADTNRAKQWNPKEQYFGKGQYLYDAKNFTSRIYYDFFYEKIINLGFPRMPYYETAFDDFYYTKRNNLGLDFLYKFNDIEKIHFLSSFNNYNRIKNTYFKDLTNLNQVLTSTSSDQDTSIFKMLMNKVVFSSTKLSDFKYQIGVDSKIEYAEGVRINNSSKKLGDHAFFVTSEWKPIANFVLRPAFRLSYNSKFNVPLIPSLNALLSKNNFKTRFSFAKGFRSPTLKELFFEFVDVNHNILGNKDLKPETSNNYQISLDYLNNYSIANIGFGTKFFYNDIKNLITLAQSPNSSEYSYFNLGVYKTIGFANSISLTNDLVSFNFGSSHTGRYNNLSQYENMNNFSFSHSLRSSIIYRIKKYNISIAAFYKFTGSLPVFYKENEEIIETIIDSYNLLDLTFSKSFFSEKLKFKIGAKNLFNIKNVLSFSAGDIHSSSSNSSSIGYGRSFFTALSFNL